MRTAVLAARQVLFLVSVLRHQAAGAAAAFAADHDIPVSSLLAARARHPAAVLLVPEEPGCGAFARVLAAAAAAPPAFALMPRAGAFRLAMPAAAADVPAAVACGAQAAAVRYADAPAVVRDQQRPCFAAATAVRLHSGYK